MKDYYYILGITREATAEEIKKAHRKLSLKFHPDQNQGDKFFEERFKELQEAYETLSNSDKRKTYHDNYEKFYFGYSKSKQNELNEKEKQLNVLKSRLEAEKTALQNKEITLNNLVAQAEKERLLLKEQETILSNLTKQVEKERLLLKEQETILTNLTKQVETDKSLFAKKEKDLKTATAQIEKEKAALQEKTKQFDLQKNHLEAEISALRSKETELNSLISQAQTEKINALAKLQRNSQNAKFWNSIATIALLVLIFIVIYQFFDKVDNTAENKNNIQPTPIKQDTNTIIANPIENPTFMLKNLNSNLYLEVKNNSNDNRAEIIQNIKTDKNSQKFVLVWAGEPNEFFIVNKGSKKVLSGQGDLGNSIIQFEKDNGERQIWIIQKNSDNTVTLKLRYSGRVADVSNGSRNAGAKVWEWEYNNTPAQKWVMEK